MPLILNTIEQMSVIGYVHQYLGGKNNKTSAEEEVYRLLGEANIILRPTDAINSNIIGADYRKAESLLPGCFAMMAQFSKLQQQWVSLHRKNNKTPQEEAAYNLLKNTVVEHHSSLSLNSPALPITTENFQPNQIATLYHNVEALLPEHIPPQPSSRPSAPSRVQTNPIVEFLGGIYGPELPAEFKTRIAPFLDASFFGMDAGDNYQRLYQLRENQTFWAVLRDYPVAAAIFLKKSVNNEPIWIDELKTNQLGHSFLMTREEQERQGIVMPRGGRDALVRQMDQMMAAAAGARMPASQQDLLATRWVDQRGIDGQSDAYQSLRCPITQSLITGAVGSVKMTNEQVQYFDDKSLRKWVAEKGTHPMTRARMTLADITPATAEYREKLTAQITEDLATLGKKTTDARAEAAAFVNQFDVVPVEAKAPKLGL